MKTIFLIIALTTTSVFPCYADDTQVIKKEKNKRLSKKEKKLLKKQKSASTLAAEGAAEDRAKQEAIETQKAAEEKAKADALAAQKAAEEKAKAEALAAQEEKERQEAEALAQKEAEEAEINESIAAFMSKKPLSEEQIRDNTMAEFPFSRPMVISAKIMKGVYSEILQKNGAKKKKKGKGKKGEKPMDPIGTQIIALKAPIPFNPFTTFASKSGCGLVEKRLLALSKKVKALERKDKKGLKTAYQNALSEWGKIKENLSEICVYTIKKKKK